MSDRAPKLGLAAREDAIDAGPDRTRDEEQARLRAAEAKREADLAAARVVAEPRRATGLRGPEWAWYTAGFAALAFAAVSLHFMRPPPPGLEPELLAAIPALPLPPQPAAAATLATLDVSASIWRHALDLTVPRLPTDVFTAVVLIDSRDQSWLVQRGERRDPTCLPACEDKLKLRVEVYKLAPGPFRVLVLASPTAIPPIGLAQWLQHAAGQPPLGLGVRAYGSARVER